MTEIEFVVCNLVFKAYFIPDNFEMPNKLGLEISDQDLRKYCRIMFDLELLERMDGVGGHDYYRLTTNARKLHSSGLRTFFLREGLLKPYTLLDRWNGLNNNQQISILGILIAAIVAIIVA